MENSEFKEVCIKNRTCYYFDGLIKLEVFDLDNILIDKISYENILIYDISYKTLIDPKPLQMKFFKIDGITRVYDGTRYLTLFGSKEYEAIYDRITDLISQKVASHIFFLTILQKSKLIFIILYL